MQSLGITFAILCAFVYVSSSWICVSIQVDAEKQNFADDSTHPAIQSLQSTPSPSTTRQRAFRIHQILLLVLALPLFAIGVSAMWYNKHSHGAKHFTSWHGLGGLIVVLWMVSVSLVLKKRGIDRLILRIPALKIQIGQSLIGGIAHSLSISNPAFKSMYKYHRLSGYFLLPSILVVAHLGGSWSDWSIGHS